MWSKFYGGRAVVALALAALPVRAQEVLLSGRVVLEGGAAPGKPVGIEKVCAGLPDVLEAITNKKGEYIWRTELGSLGRLNTGVQIRGGRVETQCVLRASLPGYVSTSIDLNDPSLGRVPQLPTLVVRRKQKAGKEQAASAPVGEGAGKAWERAAKAMEAGQWREAESALREALAASPKFAGGWGALGVTAQNLGRPEEARAAFQKAIEADPSQLNSYSLLIALEMESQNWAAVSRVASELINKDTGKRRLDAYLQRATAQFKLNDAAGAQATLIALIAEDRAHKYPRAEYLLGLMLSMAGDKTAAAAHFRKYLELDPGSKDAAEVKQRMENLARASEGEVALALERPQPERVDVGEASVPGGIRALSAISRLKEPEGYNTFFGAYCGEIARQASGWNPNRHRGYAATLESYLAAVERLEQTGVRRGDDLVTTLALGGGAGRTDAERILPLLGWRLVQRDGKLRVELGDTLEDSLRQPAAGALGIDEVAMQEALEAGKAFEIAIRQEKAALFGGAAWTALLRDPAQRGGIAGAFAKDARLARACAGLSRVTPETAAAAAAATGLSGAVTRYSTALSLYSGSFHTEGGTVSVPGGRSAHAAWTALAGAAPENAPAFFLALLEKDGGRLAAYYDALAKAGPAQQRYFTSDAKRLARFYEWYRDSDEMKPGIGRPEGAWHPLFFQELPVDESGAVHFPGGRRAWSLKAGPDDEVLVAMAGGEKLVPIAFLEKRQGKRLDEAAVKLLIEHYSDWQALFPYFEKWNGLGTAEFGALAGFSRAVRAAPAASRPEMLGLFYSLAEIVAMSGEAGSAGPSEIARAFARVCELLVSGATAGHAVEALKTIAGSGKADGALAALSASTPVRVVLEALTSRVYAARLRPELLLVSEDPHLAGRHRYVPESGVKQGPLFASTTLVRAQGAHGAYFAGGLMNLAAAAADLATRGGVARGAHGDTAERVAKGVHSGKADSRANSPMFRVSGRLVEVPVTVTDSRGKALDGLDCKEFSLLEDGRARAAETCESLAQSVSCALLLDTTGSMQVALPFLKNAALRFIEALRPEDPVAVYSFSDSVSERQPFTTDKSAAKRAVVRTEPYGETALYDAVVRVIQDLSGRGGKKVIVVFTDGADNKSALTSGIAIRVAKAYGIPIYAVAQGDAANDADLVKQLMRAARATGGLSYNIHDPGEIREVFEEISRDLRHGYMLTFKPAPAEDQGWHEIKVVLRQADGRRVRAREGYFAE